MAKIVCLFNHKGGVSKTTTAFNLGWMMALKGKRVLLADFDPQCNLTGMVLGFKGVDDLAVIYGGDQPKTLRTALPRRLSRNHAKSHQWSAFKFLATTSCSYSQGTSVWPSTRLRWALPRSLAARCWLSATFPDLSVFS